MTAPTSAPADTAASAERPAGRSFIVLYVLAYFGGFLGIFGPVVLALYSRLADVFPSSGAPITLVVALSIVQGIGAIAAMIANPLIGRLSDRTTSRWGMRRPWILISSAIFAVGMLLLAFGPADLVWLTIGWAITQTGFNGMLAVYVALLPDQVPERLRGRVSATLGIAQNLATLAAVWLIGLFAAGTIRFDDGGSVVGGEPSSPMRFLVPLAIALITALLLFFALARIDRRMDRSQVTPFTAGTFFGSFVFNPRKNPDFTWAFVSRAFFMLGIAYLIVYQAPYWEGHLGFRGGDLDQAVLWGTLATVGGTVISGYIAGRLSDRMQRRKAFVLGSALLYAASLVVLSAVPGDSSGLWLALAGFFVGGIAQGIYFGIDLALVTDVLPNREADAAKDLGVFNIASAGPQFIAPFIAPVFLGLSLFGNAEGQHNFVALFVFAAVCSAIGALLVLPIRSVK